jgi:hypothetical protein
LMTDYKTTEDEVEAEVEVELQKIESQLVPLVKRIIEPLLSVFDFFKLSDSVYEELVNDYVAGKTS